MYGQPLQAQISPEVQQLFTQADVSRTGRLSFTEVGSLLVKSDGTHFAFPVLWHLCRMFDRSKSANLELIEFNDLWNYLLHWKRSFDSVDRDRSGSISKPEFFNVLSQSTVSQGNSWLTNDLLEIIFDRFDYGRTNTLPFDEFIHAMMVIQGLVSEFRKRDPNNTNQATFSMTDFISFVLKCV